MKQKLLEILKERGPVSLLRLRELLPETKGEYSIYMPVKEGMNPNILWVAGVKNEFTELFNELVYTEKTVDVRPVPLEELIFRGDPVYILEKRLTKRLCKSKTPCWLPVEIFLTKPEVLKQ